MKKISVFCLIFFSKSCVFCWKYLSISQRLIYLDLCICFWCIFLLQRAALAQGLEELSFPAWSYLLPPISLQCFVMQICKTGIKIHPAAVCGGFPLDSFLSESSKCEGVEKQPAVLHVSCSSGAGNAAVPRSKTAISTVSRAMLPILLVLLKNMLFSCFIAPSVAHWQWWLLLLLLRESL